ncbi:MAG TPA: ChaB family protein [Candidatus Limnocylindrales bacterium]|nr:ChaB family protein [Candidatus Limnocylindrales bacterium]
MPRKGRARDETELPSTLERSPAKARRTWKKAHDSAVETYGEGERAHRTAYAALKHSFEKVGDRWEPKARRGPSDPQAAKGAPEALRRPAKTYGGVDARGNTRAELVERAKDLGVRGYSRMTKDELAEAIARKQRSRD